MEHIKYLLTGLGFFAVFAAILGAIIWMVTTTIGAIVVLTIVILVFCYMLGLLLLDR